MREAEVEQKLREATKQAGGRAYKFTSPGNSGVPDRLVVLPGGHIGFVEVKRPGERPRALQKRQMEQLTALGCYTVVVDHPDQIQTVLESIRRHTGGNT